MTTFHVSAPNDRPAPTPVSELGPLFQRQHKYNPARPYRWWEFRPTRPEAPEVFYPRIESYEEYVARHRGRKPPGFCEYVAGAILSTLIWGPWLLALKLILDGL
jgi:hypothetical protein